MAGRYPQSVHSSRCPPKAAVRQRAMAPQHFEVLPGDPFTAAFEESASRGANQIGHLEWWPVHLFALRYLVFQLERVQRTRGGVEVSLGEMEIDGGFLQITVA